MMKQHSYLMAQTVLTAERELVESRKLALLEETKAKEALMKEKIKLEKKDFG